MELFPETGRILFETGQELAIARKTCSTVGEKEASEVIKEIHDDIMVGNTNLPYLTSRTLSSRIIESMEKLAEGKVEYIANEILNPAVINICLHELRSGGTSTLA